MKTIFDSTQNAEIKDKTWQRIRKIFYLKYLIKHKKMDMTYKEYAKQLSKKASEKYTACMKAEEICLEHPDKNSYEIFNSSYIEWQMAQNDLNGFISFVIKMNINPDSKLSA